MSILVVGGAGFIGSHFILEWLAENHELVVNLDKLTYAGDLTAFSSLSLQKKKSSYLFVQGDMGDRELVFSLLKAHRIRAVINFAAESHVDRSIRQPEDFIQTNVVGTFCLLEAVRQFWEGLQAQAQSNFRFLQISTDEVYGSLAPDAPAFQEINRYQPNNPYAASKAAADHLVRSYYQTYKFPAMTLHGSNNYGPRQYPEKLIPLIIHNALRNKPLTIHGDGLQKRDWLFVLDYCHAVRLVLEAGRIGETYNIGGLNERTNLAVVKMICEFLDNLQPRHDGKLYQTGIIFTPDRPGNDRRYAMDTSKIEHELGWRPQESFDQGLWKTVQWYLDNQDWMQQVTAYAYPEKVVE